MEPPPRKPRADGQRTREAILSHAVTLATVDGLEGLSIGNLASATGMSKSGLYAHFDSKLDLQLATVEQADRVFRDEIIEPALAAPAGVPQLLTLCDGFLEHLHRRTFPGGCFFAGAALEMSTRPGPVRDRISVFQGSFVGLIRRCIETGIAEHQLPADEDPDELTFEVNGILLAANASFVMQGDAAALDMARRIIGRRLGAGPRDRRKISAGNPRR